MRKGMFVLLMTAMLCSMAQAQISLTYYDKVVWRGFELFGETDGISPQLNFKAGPLDVAARGLMATDSGYEKFQRWDGQVSYTQQFEPLFLTAGYGYYYYPDSALDFQELWATIGLPIGQVTPRYSLVRAYGDGQLESAWLHVIGADLELTENAQCFAEATYNEGFNPFGGSVDSGWSHILAGASIDVPVAERLILTPAIFYQHTLEEQVNPKQDQVWFSIGLAYKF